MSEPRKRLASSPLFEPDKMYSAGAIAEKCDVHVVTVWRWAAQGRLPKATKIGPNTSRWRGSELNAALPSE